jgi:hypothetical protein
MSTTPVYTSPFTGTVVTPTDVSYYFLSFSSDTPLYWPSIVNQGAGEVPATRIIDCVCTSANANAAIINLPEADQGTVGADILFRNLGTNTFVIKDYTGANSVSVPAGISKYFYLTNNSTPGGVWNNVTFAAGTSYADAATLAGAGLTTVNGKLATTQNMVDITSSPTISDASRAATFVWNAGAGTFYLPSSETLSNGWYIGFRNNGTGTLIFQPTSPDTLNGQQSINVNPGDSGFLMLDLTAGGFVTVGLVSPTSTAFTAATYDVDAIVGNTFNLTSYAPIIQTYIAQSGTRTATLAVTLPSITQIYILANTTGKPGYNITFQNSGSSQSPLVVPNATIATVLSDGEFLYPLTTSSIGSFFANNGSAGAPSYSFSNDTTTGMYLVGTGILGLTANGTELIQIDGSNPLVPLITVNGQLNANLISGGTF